MCECVCVRRTARAHGQGPRGLSADTPQQKEIEITILKTLTTGASPQLRVMPAGRKPRRHSNSRLPRRGRRRGRAGGSPRPSTREGGARGHSWRRPAGQLGQRRPSRPPDGQGHRGTCGRHLGVDGEERERARRRREAQQRHLQRCRGRPWIWASGRRS